MKRPILYLLFFAIPALANSQKVITRQVTDEKNIPLTGVSIFFDSCKYGVTSAINGCFTLILNDSCLNENDSVEVNYVGYKTRKFSIDSFFYDTSAIAMQPDTSSHGDVVVIGYPAPTLQSTANFPWPPPESTAQALLSNNYFKHASNLEEVNSILTNALDECGYTERRYYYTPDGFALVTKIEQISEDGKSLPGDQRWSAQTVVNHQSFLQYLKSILFSTPGYFRIIVFIVTDIAFSSSGKKISQENAEHWLSDGIDKFPNDLKPIKFSSDYDCTALIYEFKKPESDKAFLITPGTLPGDEHLKRANITANLKKQ